MFTGVDMRQSSLTSNMNQTQMSSW